MANAIQSQGDSALRNSETHPLDNATPIVAVATILGMNDELASLADRQQIRQKLPAFRSAHSAATIALTDTQIALLDLQPAGDDRDLMILAGFASMLGDQLADLVGDNPEAARLCNGLATALTSISATISNSWPAGVESVEPIYPELARSIRRDVMIAEMRRAGAQ